MKKRTKAKYIMLFTALILHSLISYFQEDIGVWIYRTMDKPPGAIIAIAYLLIGFHGIYYTVIVIVSIVFVIQTAINIYRIKQGTIPKMETETKVKIVAVCLILFCDIVQRILGVGVTWLWR